MSVFNNVKSWLGMSLIAGTMITARADNTNAPSLQITSNNKNISIEISPTTPTRIYSLQSKTNLLDESWNEMSNLRGTESNLVFNIINPDDVGFYKSIGAYEPIAPITIAENYFDDTSRGGGWSKSTNFISVVNYETNNIDVNVTYNQTGGIPFWQICTFNTPFIQTLNPGTNIVPFIFTPFTGGMGVSIDGEVHIDRQ